MSLSWRVVVAQIVESIIEFHSHHNQKEVFDEAFLQELVNHVSARKLSQK